MPKHLTSIEICAGAGGQALGLERAGFEHLALVENDSSCCATLRNIRAWKPAVREINLKEWRAHDFRGSVDLFAGGVPCPPFSRAGGQLGGDDDRDLFPTAVRLITECQPAAVLLENVRGLLHERFDDYREDVIVKPLERLGYRSMGWKVIEARQFGVPQLRPRAVFVALREPFAAHYQWPTEDDEVEPLTVGQALYREMARGGWKGAKEWSKRANEIAPTLVGGSKKHGGPDLGPTQAKAKWEQLGVNGKLIAEAPPAKDWGTTDPYLTVKMAAILQGFPKDWPFYGRKTAAYRQVGNAFPPPVAEAIGVSIAAAIRAGAAKKPRKTQARTLSAA